MSDFEQYPGQWNIPGMDDPVDGCLLVDTECQAVELVLQLDFNHCGYRPCLIEDDFCDVLDGRLFSGARVALYRCETVSRHTYNSLLLTEHITVKYAFWDLTESNLTLQLFRGATFELKDAIEWTGLSHYEWNLGEKDFGHSLVWVHREPISLSLSRGVDFSVSPTQGPLKVRIYDTKVEAEQHAAFKLLYGQDVDWDRVVEDINWFRSFAELGASTGMSVDSVHYLHDQVRIDIPGHDQTADESLRPSEVILGTRSSKRVERTHLSLYGSFSLPEAIECGALKRWFDARELLKPIVGLYSLAYSREMISTTLMFLSLMQALETLHARFYASDVVSFVNRIDAIIYAPGDGAAHPEWLIDTGQRRSRKIYLRSRLNDLLYAEGNCPVKVLGSSILDFSTKLVDTRNYLTHYDRGLETKAYGVEELRGINGRLLLLVEYHMLVFLGFNQEFARERISRKAWPMFRESWKETGECRI